MGMSTANGETVGAYIPADPADAPRLLDLLGMNPSE
jgi:hypothetical protein